MATARILLLLACFVPVFGYWLPERNLLGRGTSMSMSGDVSASMLPGMRMERGAGIGGGIVEGTRIGQGFGSGVGIGVAAGKLIRIAEQELAVRELTGQNDGIRVEMYLRYVGLKKGYAWCAAFVSWIHGQAGYTLPKSAWSPALFPASRLSSGPVPATVLGIYFPALKRIAHVGLVTGVQHDWVESIEGNTNAAGSREGDGVYRRLRHKRFINSYANYL